MTCLYRYIFLYLAIEITPFYSIFGQEGQIQAEASPTLERFGREIGVVTGPVELGSCEEKVPGLLEFRGEVLLGTQTNKQHGF